MAEKHFYEQKTFTETYLMPYFENLLPNLKTMKVLEVGCAEGGFVAVLREKGIEARGIELEESRVAIARSMDPDLPVETGDITDPALPENLNDRFDLIVMRDVIEHVPDRDALFRNINALLNPGGHFYVTFPPRFSAFAGHQQNGRTVLKAFPWLHLLPDFLIDGLGKILGEKPGLLEGVKLNYRIGLSISAFRKFYSSFGFKPADTQLFIIRPVFRIRFGLKPRKMPSLPFFREWLATGCEVLLKKM